MRFQCMKSKMCQSVLFRKCKVATYKQVIEVVLLAILTSGNGIILTAKERQANRRAKIKVDPELYEAKLLKDREQSMLNMKLGERIP